MTYLEKLRAEARERHRKFYPPQPARINRPEPKVEPAFEPAPKLSVPVELAVEAIIANRAPLQPTVNVNGEPRPSLALVLRECAKHFNVPEKDFRGPSRRQPICGFRQVFFYIAKTVSLKSFPEIGRRCGGRDHTTVLYAVRKIEARAGAEPELAATIDAIKSKIAEAFAAATAAVDPIAPASEACSARDQSTTTQGEAING